MKWRERFADAVQAMGHDLVRQVDAAAKTGWVIIRVSGWSDQKRGCVWVVQCRRGLERLVLSAGGCEEDVQEILEGMRGTLAGDGWQPGWSVGSE
jgi:hypothetical protein